MVLLNVFSVLYNYILRDFRDISEIWLLTQTKTLRASEPGLAIIEVIVSITKFSLFRFMKLLARLLPGLYSTRFNYHCLSVEFCCTDLKESLRRWKSCPSTYSVTNQEQSNENTKKSHFFFLQKRKKKREKTVESSSAQIYGKWKLKFAIIRSYRLSRYLL